MSEELWVQTGPSEDFALEGIVGMRVFESGKFGLMLATDPFDGYVYMVDPEPHYDDAKLTVIRYPATLTVSALPSG